MNILNSNINIQVGLEEYATDSYQNVLFSICRFYEITQSYPSKITMVGYDFKYNRFMDIIRNSLFLYDNIQFTYIAIKPNNQNFNYMNAVNGEKVAYNELLGDKYGCYTDDLRNKRILRNPFNRVSPYSVSNPQLRDIINWCGPDYFPGRLPWK
jgi:hypothetical protein